MDCTDGMDEEFCTTTKFRTPSSPPSVSSLVQAKLPFISRFYDYALEILPKVKQHIIDMAHETGGAFKKVITWTKSFINENNY